MAIDGKPPADKPKRWGDDYDEGDYNNLDYLLPPKQVIGPDPKGIKKVIEYKFDEEGRRVKVTTTFKVTKVRLSGAAVERRGWARFGDAVAEDDGANLTVASTEDIVLERPGSKKEAAKDIQPAEGGSLMVCRNCNRKGDHWTARCPYKDLAQPSESFADKPSGSGSTCACSTSGGSTSATNRAYVPPGMRAGAERPSHGGSDMRRRNDENSVRVSNLSEDTREEDLRELFRPFGSVTRVYVAMDQKTGVSRGFGFVNFVLREDAERAISKLNGYGYDNLILHVEWATPRPN